MYRKSMDSIYSTLITVVISEMERRVGAERVP